jgi:flagellar biosynthetic protein FliR
LADYAVQQTMLWLLFLMRALGFVFLAPMFSVRSAPPLFRLALGFLLAVLAYVAWAPTGAAPAWAAPHSFAEFLPLALSELVLGLGLGFFTGLAFVTIQWAGSLIGYQMGFAIVNVLDPHSQTQSSIVGEFLFAVSMLVFLDLNLHHDVLRLWHQSYALAPPGSFSLGAATPALFGGIMDQLGYLALQLALPLMAFLLLTDLALGILARIMPQMNVFAVGLSLKIGLGLLLLSFYVMGLDPLVHKVVYAVINDAGAWLHQIAGQK